MENKQMVFDNIHFLNDYIPKLINGIDQLYDYLITNNETEIFSLFTKLLEGLEWTVRSINSLEELGYVKGVKIDKINSLLEEIEASFLRKDYVTLGDLFQYELVDILNEWLNKTQQIVEEGSLK